jgi:phage shock protein C
MQKTQAGAHKNANPLLNMETQTMPRRTKFYLDKSQGKFLGVCSGIAYYTGIDALWVRLFLVLSTVFGAAPFTIIGYFIIAFLADKKPPELYSETPEKTRFWRDVRLAPSATLGSTRTQFRDIDRRLRDIETYVTSSNRGLAAEIDKLR